MRSLALASFLILFVWLLWDVLFLPNHLAFRDAAHFYYPLFEFVEQQWRAGRIPLWNPYANSGEPLLANSTSAVLYPGKLIFWLPMSFDAAYKTYILAHLFMAGGSAYLLARRWQSGIPAATVCGLSYAFSGHIFFQIYNVVFLCAAAWLPLAILAGDAMLRSRRYRYALGLGATLALMILCGDPQLAYEAGLLVALAALLYWRADRSQVASAKREMAGWKRSRPALLLTAALWTAALSAAQVLPTAELSRLSDRAMFDVPRNWAEIPAYLARDFEPPPHRDGTPARWYDAMLGRPPLRSIHTIAMHDFSITPLRMAEWIWPNFSGQMVPVHRRWLGALTKEGPFWTSSLYMGLLPLLLALAAWRLRTANVRVVWMSWMVLIGVLGSLGSYGLGWLLRHLTGSQAIGDQVGGVYWLLSVALPGFAEFRYPAKMLTPAALGLSVLAAFGWRQFAIESQGRLMRWLPGIAAASVVGLLVMLAVAPRWNDWLAGYRDGYFGPLQADQAYWDLVRSLVHALLVAFALWLVLRLACAPHAESADRPDRADVHATKRWCEPVLLLLVLFDLAVAQGGLVLTAPVEDFHTKPALASLWQQADQEWTSQPSMGPYRVFGLYDALTAGFANTSSPQRVAEGLRRERAGMQPKYNFPARQAVAFTGGTVELFDYQLFLSPVIQPEPLEYTQARRALDALGTKYFLLPAERDVSHIGSPQGLENEWLQPPWSAKRPQLAPQGAPLPPAVDDAARWLGPLGEHVRVLYNNSHFPRAWIVRDLVVTKRIDSADRTNLMPMLESLLFPYDRWIDFRTMAWVEEEEMLRYARNGRLALPASDVKEVCRVVRHDPQRVEIEAELATPGLVVLADLYYPGWELTAETGGRQQSLPIFRTDRILRGALLPAGKHRLIYEYRSWNFYVGAAVSAAAWLAALGVTVLLEVGRRRAVRIDSTR